MSTEGKVSTDNVVVAKVDALKTVNGKNAYEMAVIHGYTGTFEDWIESITSGRLTDGHREAIANLVVEKNGLAIELEKNARIEADNFILEALGLDEVSETAYEDYCLKAVNRINETLGFVQPEYKAYVFGERRYIAVTLENGKEKYTLQSTYDDEYSHTFTYDFTSYRGCRLVCRSTDAWESDYLYGYALYDSFGDEIIKGGNTVTVEGKQSYDFVIDIPSNAGDFVISCHSDCNIKFDVEPIFAISKNVNSLMKKVPAVEQTIIANSTNPISSKAVYEYGEEIRGEIPEFVELDVTETNFGEKDIYNANTTNMVLAEIVTVMEEVQDSVDNTKEQVNNLGFIDINTLPRTVGYLQGSGTWSGLANYEFVLIPVKPDEKVRIKANSNGGYIACLTEYIGVIGTASLSTEGMLVASTGERVTTRVTLSKTAEETYTMPSDAKYLWLCTLESGADRLPKILTINSYDILRSARENVANKVNVSDLEKVENDIASAREDIADIDLNTIHKRLKINGYLSNQTPALWTNVNNEGYQHIMLPVSGAKKLRVRRNDNAASTVAFLATRPESIANNDVVPFSDENESNHKRYDIGKEEVVEFDIPDGTNYLFVGAVFGGTNCIPSMLDIDGYDYFKSARENIFAISKKADAPELKDDVADLKATSVSASDIFNGFSLKPKWESGMFSTTVGSSSSLGGNNARQRSGYMSFPDDLSLENDGTYKLRLTLYDDDYNVVTAGSYRTDTYIVPKNTIFRMCISNAANDSLDISSVTSDEINAHFSFTNKRLANIIKPNVKWCAMGDSITEGIVSYYDEATQTNSYKGDRPNAWVAKMADRKNWDVTNEGIGGTGYIRNHDGKTDAAWNVAANIDFKNFDIVTLAYGVNDWKYNKVLGELIDTSQTPISTPTTIYGGMQKTIETIITSNPLCKIYVITPINCAAKGDESTNWGLGSAYTNNGTLERIYEAIKEVCEYYGIEMIDMTHSSVVNRKNIQTCLLDGVHPTAEIHTVMARELGAKINYI